MSDSFLCSPPFSRRLLYYTTSAFLCQEVFPKFFELFSTASLRSASVSQSLLSATFILYHIRFALSSGFLNFFSSFFQPSIRLPYALPSPRQPRYYIIPYSSCQALFLPAAPLLPFLQKTVHNSFRCTPFCTYPGIRDSYRSDKSQDPSAHSTHFPDLRK